MKKFSQSADRPSVKAIACILLLIFSLLSFGRESGSIIQVKRKIRMSYLEPLPPQEYFVDLGTREGVKAGDTLEVYRYVPVVSGQAGGPWHLMRVAIGELHVKFVGETSCLGRTQADREPSSLPPMEYQSLMIGDEVVRKTQLPTQ